MRFINEINASFSVSDYKTVDSFPGIFVFSQAHPLVEVREDVINLHMKG